ncbi:MAG TPA: DUF488 domain-containing protein [Anaerolineae bacterium]|nr:DUF488 domain-containing protein [Anaerolineae bacterium]HIP71166.1 DUF488 domain-containing protein [Anaerolineae bacterium]
MIKIVTIGVYGSTEEQFFQALQEANVDTFCDIRQRRGVRGAKYAFVNSKRLQARLAEMGIRYLHRKDLAPTTAVRQRQKEADKAGKTAKRQRATLGPAFIDAYEEEILADFTAQSLLDDLEPDAQVVALFCVEREPAACHRSLAAAKLQRELEVEVEHILP